jgi:hypothetical protein
MNEADEEVSRWRRKMEEEFEGKDESHEVKYPH